MGRSFQLSGLGITAGSEYVEPNTHAAVQEWADEDTTQFFYRSANTLFSEVW